MKRKMVIIFLATVIAASGCACSASNLTDGDSVSSEEGIAINETIENSVGGEHAITADGETASYANVEVIKTGDSELSDEADFYGDNAAVFATNGATLTLSGVVVDTDGTHANAVFSYGEGTTVNITDSYIETSGNCSGGLMTTGGGTMNAERLTIHTTGNSSAAIRSDRGGGTVTVNGGTYTTDGTGSPVIYSTADITVSNATLTSTASQGVVVEGQNSVTLNNVNLTADNNTKNSDKSDYYQAIMIYQSMSGDADDGTAEFTTNGGTIENVNGDIFFVNNTVAKINLSETSIINNDTDGVFLRAAAAGWGNEGSNGGQVALTATGQTIDGDIVVDDVSALNLYLTDLSNFTGAINQDGAAGDVYVELTNGSKWTLTADSYITSLTCDGDSIDLNGHTLTVNGTAYTSGSSSTGNPIEFTVSSHGENLGDMDTPPDGNGGGMPNGNSPDNNNTSGAPDNNSKADGGSQGPGNGEIPPEKPDGNGGAPNGNPPSEGGGQGGTPPDRPGA